MLWIKKPSSKGEIPIPIKYIDRLSDFLKQGTITFEDINNGSIFKTSDSADQIEELFEKYLPFALALGVEQAWSDQFADRLQISSQGPWKKEYEPNWYHGRHFDVNNLTAFSSSLSSGFSSAISSASTSPGSSSGSSGGGSSGGGGGGGGGGGW